MIIEILVLQIRPIVRLPILSHADRWRRCVNSRETHAIKFLIKLRVVRIRCDRIGPFITKLFFPVITRTVRDDVGVEKAGE